MLACVCQPADTTRLFGAAGTRSPVNLGAVPKSRPLRPPKPCASSTKNTASSLPAATFTRETADCNLSRSALDVASKPHPPSPTAGGDASVKINTEIASTTSSPIRYYSDKEQTSKEYYINFSASNFVPNANVLTVTTCSANIETKSNVGVTDTAKKQSDINNVKSLTNVEKTNMTNNSSKVPVSNTVKLRTDVMPNIPNCKETKNTSVSKQMRPLKMCSSSITSPVRVHSVIKHANSNSLSSSSSCSSITGTKSASGSDDQTKILPTISPKNVKTPNNTPSNATNFEKLPDGVALTLGELRDMAWRQQHQLEAQHRLLAAREQRLRHLKEQEMARVAGENERLRRLRERVDAQELKLRRLRALRGQVDHAKHNNALLTSDLESIRALFNEKEKELSVAVAKVDELTRQLEELRRGRQSEPPTGASLELEKLRRELMYRNKFNEQQNAKLSQQREALTQRQEEIINIDKRISELQDRLNRKRVLNQQLANQIASTNKTTNQVQSNPSMIQQNPPMLLENPHPILTKQHSRGNIAAIEPYNHVPLPTPDQNHFVEKPKQPASAFFTQTNSNQINQNNANNLKPQKQEEPTALKAPNEQVKNESNDFIAEFNGSKSDPKYQTLPYNTKFSVNFVSTTKVNKDVQLLDADKNINEADSVQNVNSKSTHQPHMTVHSTPLSTINKGLAVPLSQNDNTYHDKFMQQKQQNELKNALHHLEQPPRALHPHNGSARGQPVGGPSTSSSSISTVINNNNLNINQQKPISSVAPTSLHLGSNKPSAIYQTSSMKIQPVQPQTIQTTLQTPSYSHNTNGNIHAQQMVLTPPNSTSTPLGTPDTIPKPVLPPKPAIKPPPRQMQPITDLDKDMTPPPIPTSEPPQEIIPSNQQVKQHDNKPIKARPLTIKKQPLGEQQPKLRNIPKLNGVHVSINRRIEMPPAFLFPEMSTPPSDLISINQNENTNNSNKTIVNNNTIDNLTQSKSNTQQKSQDETDKAVPDDKISELEEENKKNALDKVPMNVGENLVVRRNKGNLKQNGKVNLSRRVSFDPLALLLDASLEGELELVKKTATQVTNPSAANDEGITALHNAICAGHLEIVQFLVEFGCDVNAQDSDGWTPLHCAASCNNVAMVKFLVEHGACIFATTLSDHETAAEKCEEDEEGFDGCSEYLYSVQEKLGILSGGAVFAVFDYVAQQADELNFSAGQQLTVLRKGDENEREWWWARLGDKEGYIPRNLLGLYPRVIPKSE